MKRSWGRSVQMSSPLNKSSDKLFSLKEEVYLEWSTMLELISTPLGDHLSTDPKVAPTCPLLPPGSIYFNHMWNTQAQRSSFPCMIMTAAMSELNNDHIITFLWVLRHSCRLFLWCKVSGMSSKSWSIYTVILFDIYSLARNKAYRSRLKYSAHVLIRAYGLKEEWRVKDNT